MKVGRRSFKLTKDNKRLQIAKTELTLAGLGVKILDRDHLSSRDPGMDPDNFGAGVAVCPKSVDEVRAVVRLCAENSIPLVPQGGRTGLAGACQSEDGQIILMTDQLDKIIEINTMSGIALVEAGVTLQTLEEAVSEVGLSVGIDLGARGSCTIGAMVATNAGGTEAFRNGVMRQRVLGLEAVLPDGSLMSDLKQVIKANEGYDVKQLLIGSEGTLGVVTRIALKLEPVNRNRQTVLAATRNAAATLEFHHRLTRAFGTRYLSAEIMWRDYFEATCNELNFANRFEGFEGDTYFLFEVDLPKEDDALLDVFAEGMEADEVADALIAQNSRESTEIWAVREESFLIDKRFPGGCWFDISVPLDKLDTFVQESSARIYAVDPGLKIFVFGHLGDGNLHYTIAADDPVDHLYAQISDALYTGLSDIGGSFSAEHGIGIEKRSSLAKFGDPGKLAMMRAIKQAIDPQNIMNPGKILI